MNLGLERRWFWRVALSGSDSRSPETRGKIRLRNSALQSLSVAVFYRTESIQDLFEEVQSTHPKLKLFIYIIVITVICCPKCQLVASLSTVFSTQWSLISELIIYCPFSNEIVFIFTIYFSPKSYLNCRFFLCQLLLNYISLTKLNLITIKYIYWSLNLVTFIFSKINISIFKSFTFLIEVLNTEFILLCLFLKKSLAFLNPLWLYIYIFVNFFYCFLIIERLIKEMIFFNQIWKEFNRIIVSINLFFFT